MRLLLLALDFASNTFHGIEAVGIAVHSAFAIKLV